MRFTTKNKFLLILFSVSFITFAQPKKQKVDGVIGVVGDYVILDSDIDFDTPTQILSSLYHLQPGDVNL